MPVPWFQLFESDAGGQTQALPPRSTEVSHSVQQLFHGLWIFDISVQISTAVCHIHPAVPFLWAELSASAWSNRGRNRSAVTLTSAAFDDFDSAGGGEIFLCIGCVLVCVGIQQSMRLPYWSWIKAKIPFMLICRCLKDKQTIFPTRFKSWYWGRTMLNPNVDGVALISNSVDTLDWNMGVYVFMVKEMTEYEFWPSEDQMEWQHWQIIGCFTCLDQGSGEIFQVSGS